MQQIKHSKGGALQRQLDYRYDVFGNLIGQELNAGASVEALQYDVLQRLTQTTRTGGATGSVSYAYDAAGNFTAKSDFSSTAASAYSYTSGTCGGGANAVKTVALKSGGSRSYCYDASGNLVSDNASFSAVYDALNLAVKLQRGTLVSQFAYGPDGDKAREWGSDGTRIFSSGYED